MNNQNQYYPQQQQHQQQQQQQQQPNAGMYQQQYGHQPQPQYNGSSGGFAGQPNLNYDSNDGQNGNPYNQNYNHDYNYNNEEQQPLVHPQPQQPQQYQEPQQHQQSQQQQQYNQYYPAPSPQQQNMQHPLAHSTTTGITTASTASHAMTREPYVDPETLIVYPCNNPEFEGWLTKQSMWLKDWRRRYFILSGSKLFFAKNPYSAPHGMIDLGTATTVKSADIKSRKKYSFEISTHDMTYLMYADNEKEKDDWIGSVGRSIVRCSGTFLSRNDVKGGGNTGGGNGYGDDEDDDDDHDGVFENSENHPYFND
jgi:hypothetical protein